MPKFILHDLPPDVWARFAERAQAEGWPRPELITQLMDDYGAGRIQPSCPPPLRPAGPPAA